MDARRLIVKLPALPKSWDEISSRNLEEIHRLMARRRVRASALGEAKAESLYYLDCFLLLCGLKVKRSYVDAGNGEYIYLFRRKGWKHLFESIPMKANVVRWWMRQLSFLEKEQTMYNPPYDIIKLKGRKFKCPGVVMADITYHQYMRAQNLLISYWNIMEKVEECRDLKAAHKLVAECKKTQRSFLAVLFNQETTVLTENGGELKLPKPRKDFKYIDIQDEINERYFKSVSDRMFPVMVQFFQSCQSYFATLFPDLFTSSGEGNQEKNVLKIELETVNSVMKHQGFRDYDTIYNSQAVRILDVLNQMSKEAKEIRRMQSGLKSKK